jgi:ADP-ribose pyrophosphatase YjhB (NUDIX family)
VSHVAVCPHCAQPSDLPIVCDRCGWRWLANPYPAAGTLVERMDEDGQASVLLLRRALEPGLGAWDLPAGFLEPQESMEEAALRETLEESGLHVELVHLVGVYASPEGNAVAAVFLARPMDGSAAVETDAESNDHAWVRKADVGAWLPRMAFASMAQALADWADDRYGVPHLA